MPRLRILQVPNFNVAVQRGPVAGFGAVALPLSPPLAVPVTTAKLVCTGGNYDCPEGWTDLGVSALCPPNGPCPTYEATCKGADTRLPGAIREVVLPAKQAILRTLPPLAPGGGTHDISAYDKGKETCEYQCPQGYSLGPVVGAPYLPPTCVPHALMVDNQEGPLGISRQVWVLGAVGIGLAFAIGAVLWSRRKAVPNFGNPRSFGGDCNYRQWWVFHDEVMPGEADFNALYRRWERQIIGWVRKGKNGPRPIGPGYDRDDEVLGDQIEACHTRLMGGWKFMSNSAELMAQYLPRSPEAALMLMPPAIPSYLAYRYALKRMRPEDAEFAEQWRDYVPSDEPEWDDWYDE